MYAAEAGPISDLGEGELVVNEEFLYFLRALKDEELFDRFSFDGGKQIAEITVIVGNAVDNK